MKESRQTSGTNILTAVLDSCIHACKLNGEGERYNHEHNHVIHKYGTSSVHVVVQTVLKGKCKVKDYVEAVILIAMNKTCLQYRSKCY